MFALFSRIQPCTQTRGWKCSGSRGDRSSTHTFPGRKQGQGKHCFVRANIAQSCPGGGCCYLATSKSVWNLLETLLRLRHSPHCAAGCQNHTDWNFPSQGQCWLKPLLDLYLSWDNPCSSAESKNRNQTWFELTKKFNLNTDLDSPMIFFLAGSQQLHKEVCPHTCGTLLGVCLWEITDIIRDRAHSTIKDIFSELSPAANSLGQLGGRHWPVQGCKVSVSCSLASFQQLKGYQKWLWY